MSEEPVNDFSSDEKGDNPSGPPQPRLPPEELEKLHQQHICGLRLRESRNSRSKKLLRLRHGDLTSKELELEGRNFRNAEFLNVNFSGQNLAFVEFVGAELQSCDLRSADLLNADLRNSVLENCDFAAVKNLSTAQLGGSSIQGSNLPDSLATIDIGALTGDLIRNAKKISLLLNTACIYTVITIFSPPPGDSASGTSATLPLLANEIPMASFLYLSPLVIFLLFLYFCIYSQRVWDALARLPSVLVDGRPIPEHAYPWLPVGIIYFYSPVLKKRIRPPLSRLQLAACIVLTWCVVPFTAALLFLKSLDLSDPMLRVLLGAILLFVSGISLTSYAYSARTLRNEAEL